MVMVAVGTCGVFSTAVAWTGRGVLVAVDSVGISVAVAVLVAVAGMARTCPHSGVVHELRHMRKTNDKKYVSIFMDSFALRRFSPHVLPG
jgi:hypothetical protein